MWNKALRKINDSMGLSLFGDKNWVAIIDERVMKSTEIGSPHILNYCDRDHHFVFGNSHFPLSL